MTAKDKAALARGGAQAICKAEDSLKDSGERDGSDRLKFDNSTVSCESVTR